MQIKKTVFSFLFRKETYHCFCRISDNRPEDECQQNGMSYINDGSDQIVKHVITHTRTHAQRTHARTHVHTHFWTARVVSQRKWVYSKRTEFASPWKQIIFFLSRPLYRRGLIMCFTVMFHWWGRWLLFWPHMFVTWSSIGIKDEVSRESNWSKPSTSNPITVVFVLTVPRRILCCNSYVFVRRWLHPLLLAIVWSMSLLWFLGKAVLLRLWHFLRIFTNILDMQLKQTGSQDGCLPCKMAENLQSVSSPIYIWDLLHVPLMCTLLVNRLED